MKVGARLEEQFGEVAEHAPVKLKIFVEYQ